MITIDASNETLYRYKLKDHAKAIFGPFDRKPVDINRVLTKFLKIFDKDYEFSEKALSIYIRGFETTFIEYIGDDKYRFKIQPGTAIINDTLIEVFEDVQIDFTIKENTNYYIVVQYQQLENFPEPIPYYKIVREQDLQEEYQLWIAKFTKDGTNITLENIDLEKRRCDIFDGICNENEPTNDFTDNTSCTENKPISCKAIKEALINTLINMAENKWYLVGWDHQENKLKSMEFSNENPDLEQLIEKILKDVFNECADDDPNNDNVACTVFKQFVNKYFEELIKEINNGDNITNKYYTIYYTDDGKLSLMELKEFLKLNELDKTKRYVITTNDDHSEFIYINLETLGIDTGDKVEPGPRLFKLYNNNQEFEYDENNKLIKEIFHNLNDSYIQYLYNDNGDIIEEKYFYKDPNDNNTEKYIGSEKYEYNYNGDVTRQYWESANEDIEVATELSKKPLVLRLFDEFDTNVKFEYNDNKQVIKITYIDLNSSYKTLTYRDDGRLDTEAYYLYNKDNENYDLKGHFQYYYNDNGTADKIEFITNNS